MNRVIIALAVLAVCLPGAAFAQGRGGGPMMEKVLKDVVGLSDAQIGKIQDLQYKADREKIDIHHELQKARLDLEQMMRADKPNRSKVLGQVEKIGALETNLKKNRVGLMLDIRGLVTADQWQKMEALHAERKMRRQQRRMRRRMQGAGGPGAGAGPLNPFSGPDEADAPDDP